MSNTGWQAGIALAGRILLSAIFLISGFGKLTHPAQTLSYMEAQHLPAAQVGLWLAIVVELGGGLLLVLGLLGRVAALVLFIFLVPTTLIFHRFWGLPPEAVQMQQVNFLKNLAILGGLLMVVAAGPGGFSIDHAFRRAQPGARAATNPARV